MNYGEQKQALLTRFTTSHPISDWLRAAYTEIWNSNPWSFKHVSLATWYVTVDGSSSGAPTAAPLMPSDLARVKSIVDEQGFPLREVTTYEFDSLPPQVTGRPTVYAMAGRQAMLWPPPDSPYKFSISYERRLSTRNSSGVVQPGWYTADTDQPLWDDHHYVICVRAQMIGLAFEQDPTAFMMEDHYQALLEAMRSEYVTRLPAGYQLPAWR